MEMQLSRYVVVNADYKNQTTKIDNIIDMLFDTDTMVIAT